MDTRSPLLLLLIFISSPTKTKIFMDYLQILYYTTMAIWSSVVAAKMKLKKKG
ncbi:hypothetical protein Fmac_003335 [Flemingia macrophylla]|uniref:Uncharacterized protein n=1 Tax=Flemingia macrophylla TaxID=520843 RepID=A0ABD1NMG5_9FABA